MHGHLTLTEPLGVERIPSLDALTALAAEWEQIDRQITPRTPFTSAAWNISWWKHFSRCRRLLFHDEFFCHVVRGDGGRLVAVAPLMLTSAPGIGAPVLRMIQFFGADAALTEIRGVICLPNDHVQVIKTLAEYFRANQHEWDVFRWAGLRKADDFEGALPSVFDPRGALPDYIVDLPGTWDDLRLRVSSNMRKNLRKAYEFLERDGVAFTLRVAERSDDVAAAMNRFLALHAARSEAADMIVHPNKFVPAHVRAFLGDYLLLAVKRGEAKIFELEIGGTVVASRLTFLLGSDLYFYFAGYDPAWRAYSVMTVLMAETIKWAFAQGIERVNLSTGQDQSKLRWKPREVLFWDAVQVSSTLRAQAAVRLFRSYEAWGRRRARLMRDRAVPPT